MDTDDQDIIDENIDGFINQSKGFLSPLAPLYMNKQPGLGTYILFNCILWTSYLLYKFARAKKKKEYQC